MTHAEGLTVLVLDRWACRSAPAHRSQSALRPHTHPCCEPDPRDLPGCPPGAAPPTSFFPLTLLSLSSGLSLACFYYLFTFADFPKLQAPPDQGLGVFACFFQPYG